MGSWNHTITSNASLSVVLYSNIFHSYHVTENSTTHVTEPKVAKTELIRPTTYKQLQTSFLKTTIATRSEPFVHFDHIASQVSIRYDEY